jgi:hypothetical protein
MTIPPDPYPTTTRHEPTDSPDPDLPVDYTCPPAATQTRRHANPIQSKRQASTSRTQATSRPQASPRTQQLSPHDRHVSPTRHHPTCRHYTTLHHPGDKPPLPNIGPSDIPTRCVSHDIPPHAEPLDYPSRRKAPRPYPADYPLHVTRQNDAIQMTNRDRTFRSTTHPLPDHQDNPAHHPSSHTT